MLRDQELLYKGTPKADVFSFAIIMQEVILRSHPYSMMELDAAGSYISVLNENEICKVLNDLCMRVHYCFQQASSYKRTYWGVTL